MHNSISREDDAPRVYAMCRISRAKAGSDVSIAEQKSAARRYRKENLSGYRWAEESYPEKEPAGFFVDRGVSAWKYQMHERPAGGRLLSCIKEGDILLVYSVDRGFRNVADFGNTMTAMQAQGVDVRFVTQEGVNPSTASGKLLGNMMASIAQYSSDIKSERIREAWLMKKLGLVEKKIKEPPKVREWVEGDFVIPEEDHTDELLPGTVFPYIRCSHTKSLESGLGLAAQEEAVSKYCDSLLGHNSKLTVRETLRDEAVSAFCMPLEKRPSGKILCEEPKAGDHVVVYRLDRAFRSLRDACKRIDKWMADGVIFHLVSDGIRTDDPFGKLHCYTMSYISWVESYMLSVRSTAVAKYLKERKRPAGEISRGMKVIKRGRTKRLTLDIHDLARHKMVVDQKKKLGLSAEALGEYLEKLCAKVAGRKIMPESSTGTGKESRFYTIPRVKHMIANWPKISKIIEANQLDLPDLDGLIQAGALEGKKR